MLLNDARFIGCVAKGNRNPSKISNIPPKQQQNTKKYKQNKTKQQHSFHLVRTKTGKLITPRKVSLSVKWSLHLHPHCYTNCYTNMTIQRINLTKGFKLCNYASSVSLEWKWIDHVEPQIRAISLLYLQEDYMTFQKQSKYVNVTGAQHVNFDKVIV